MMNGLIDKYLAEVEQRLKALSVSERIDILTEIKSHIYEKQAKQQAGIAEILQELGSPSELARAYVAEGLTDQVKFRLSNLLRIVAFYSTAGLSGVFVVPFLAVLSVGLYFVSIMLPVLGLIKSLAAVVGIEVPYAIMMFGNYQPPAILSFFISLPLALLLYYLAKKLWQVLKRYLAGVSQHYEKVRMSIRV